MGPNLGLRGKKGSFPKGIHPPACKHLSADVPIEVLPSPKNVLLPLMQHIGAPCVPIVKTRQSVVLGQKIASSDAFVSSPIHASLTGKILKETVTTLPNGRHVPAIPIEADGDQLEGQDLWNTLFGGNWSDSSIGNENLKDISGIVREAGIVGLGGAAFPTHVKVAKNDKKPVDTLLVNGCECEPYLTTDYRLMIDAPAPIVTGALITGRAIGVKHILICIEDNKPEAIESMAKAATGTGINIAILKTKYPQGSEKHMILAVLNRTVPLGGLPGDVGVSVNNVGTIAAIAGAVLRKRPLTHRIVCVTGNGIARPKNLLVPIGTAYSEIMDYCGGLTSKAARVISGGPMMGFTLTDFSMPITKGTSGITVLSHDDIKKGEETPCLRCGRCVDVCPMNLVPARLAVAARHGDIELAEKYNIMGCLETGCCAYICPANIPLVQLIRTGKAMVAAARK